MSDDSREYFESVAHKLDEMRRTFFGEGVRVAADAPAVLGQAPASTMRSMAGGYSMHGKLTSRKNADGDLVMRCWHEPKVTVALRFRCCRCYTALRFCLYENSIGSAAGAFTTSTRTKTRLRKNFVFDRLAGVCVTTRCNEEVTFHTFRAVSPFTAGSWRVRNLCEQRNEADGCVALPAMVRG